MYDIIAYASSTIHRFIILPAFQSPPAHLGSPSMSFTLTHNYPARPTATLRCSLGQCFPTDFVYKTKPWNAFIGLSVVTLVLQMHRTGCKTTVAAQNHVHPHWKWTCIHTHIIMESFGFTRVLACFSPLRSSTVEVPENTAIKDVQRNIKKRLILQSENEWLSSVN